MPLNENDVLVFSDAAVRAADGKDSFVFMLNKENVVSAGAVQGPKVLSPKEIEARAVLFSLMNAKKERISAGFACCQTLRRWCKQLMERMI